MMSRLPLGCAVCVAVTMVVMIMMVMLTFAIVMLLSMLLFVFLLHHGVQVRVIQRRLLGLLRTL